MRILGFPKLHSRSGRSRYISVSILNEDSWLPKVSGQAVRKATEKLFQSSMRILGFPKRNVFFRALGRLLVSILNEDSWLPKETDKEALQALLDSFNPQ